MPANNPKYYAILEGISTSTGHAAYTLFLEDFTQEELKRAITEDLESTDPDNTHEVAILHWQEVKNDKITEGKRLVLVTLGIRDMYLSGLLTTVEYPEN